MPPGLREANGDAGEEARPCLQLLDRQAKLRLQLDEPAASPDELMARVQEIINFSASLPQAFQELSALALIVLLVLTALFRLREERRAGPSAAPVEDAGALGGT